MKSSTIRGNGSWDAAQQLLTTASNAIVTLLLVTAVSVSDYGVYSYAVAISSLGMSVMTAGLSGLAVKKLVEDRAANSAIVTSLLLARELFAIVGYVLVVVVSLSSRDFPSILATIVAATSLFGRGLEAPEMWFLSHLRSRRIAIVRSAIALVLLAARLAILYTAPSIWIFLALFALEPVITGWLIILRYLKEEDSPKFKFRELRRARALVRESFPLMLSGLANQVNLKGDVLVLQAIQGSAVVAVYSLAARISELAHFLPVVFMNSLLPHVLETRKIFGSNSAQYSNSLYRVYARAFWAGIVIAGLVIGAGILVIPVVFGDAYRDSVAILAVHICATPFVFMAAVYSKWIIAEGLLWVSLVRHGAGAVLNLVLCAILIPLYGGIGAALATLASYTLASYGSCFIGRRTVGQGILMTRAMVAPVPLTIRGIRHFVVSRRISRGKI